MKALATRSQQEDGAHFPVRQPEGVVTALAAVSGGLSSCSREGLERPFWYTLARLFFNE